ncbi:hypothetical protein RDI58_012289 [Solanum bulbocastanum]|uniref:Uncharacterized protein n=1 Tax=Solanum bulbocastanum TaxID=147425 RepID=A0AAN8TN31_SOLBU
MTEAMGAVEMVDSDGFFGVDSRLQKNEDDLLDRVFSLNMELGFFGRLGPEGINLFSTPYLGSISSIDEDDDDDGGDGGGGNGGQ